MPRSFPWLHLPRSIPFPSAGERACKGNTRSRQRNQKKCTSCKSFEGFQGFAEVFWEWEAFSCSPQDSLTLNRMGTSVIRALLELGQALAAVCELCFCEKFIYLFKSKHNNSLFSQGEHTTQGAFLKTKQTHFWGKSTIIAWSYRHQERQGQASSTPQSRQSTSKRFSTRFFSTRFILLSTP